jgi:hypothetical protein
MTNKPECGLKYYPGAFRDAFVVQTQWILSKFAYSDIQFDRALSQKKLVRQTFGKFHRQKCRDLPIFFVKKWK